MYCVLTDNWNGAFSMEIISKQLDFLLSFMCNALLFIYVGFIQGWTPHKHYQYGGAKVCLL